MVSRAENRQAEPAADGLDALLRARGLGRYGVFLSTGEGKTLPDGSESESGYVIDQSGRAHFYWLDWDAERAAPTLKVWDEVSPMPAWAEEREYQLARQSAGLAPAGPQERQQ